MAESPGDNQNAADFLADSAAPTCRLCGSDAPNGVTLFSGSAASAELEDKCQKCLPVLVSFASS